MRNSSYWVVVGDFQLETDQRLDDIYRTTPLVEGCHGNC